MKITLVNNKKEKEHDMVNQTNPEVVEEVRQHDEITPQMAEAHKQLDAEQQEREHFYQTDEDLGKEEEVVQWEDPPQAA